MVKGRDKFVNIIIAVQHRFYNSENQLDYT